MKKVGVFLITLILILSAMSLRPVSIINEEKAISLTGIISNVYDNGQKDIFIETENSHTKYYINRGLDKGLQLDVLKRQLLGQKVTLKYPAYWTPLDWSGKTNTFHN